MKTDTENRYQPQELLEQVDQAIQSILAGGQSYKIGSRSLTRADLSLLRQMRKELTAELAGVEESCLMPHTCVAFFESR